MRHSGSPSCGTRLVAPVYFANVSYFLYILQSRTSGKYYIGNTSDLEDRLRRHNSGRSKYTRTGIPWDLIYTEEYPTRSEARLIEREIKGWKSHKRTERLVRPSRDL